MGGRNYGKAFESHFRASMDLAGMHPERIPDHPNQHVLSTGDLMGQTPGGAMAFVECKSHKVARFSKSGLPLSEHTRRQLGYLDRKAREWGAQHVLLAIELRDQQGQRTTWRTCYVCAVTDAVAYCEQTGRCSLNRAWLNEHAVEARWLGNGLFDLGEVLARWQ